MEMPKDDKNMQEMMKNMSPEMLKKHKRMMALKAAMMKMNMEKMK